MLNAVGAAASQRPVRIRAQKKKSLAGAWPGRRQATPEGQIALPAAGGASAISANALRPPFMCLCGRLCVCVSMCVCVCVR